jgi:hypothetical protein
MGNTFAPAGHVGIPGPVADGVHGRTTYLHTHFEDAQKYNEFVRTRSDIYVDTDVLSGTDMFQATPIVQTYEVQTGRLVTRELDRQWGYEMNTNIYRATVGTWSSEHGRFIVEDKRRIKEFNERLTRVVLHGEVPNFPINFREGFQRNRAVIRNAILPPPPPQQGLPRMFQGIVRTFFGGGGDAGAAGDVDLGALSRDAQNVHTTPVIHFALGRIERWEEFAKTLGIRTDTYVQQKELIDQVFRTQTAKAGGEMERIYGYNFGFDVTYFGPLKMAERVRKITSNVPDNVMSTDFFYGRKKKPSLNSLFDVGAGAQVFDPQSLDELFQVHPYLEQEIMVDIELMKAQGYLTFDSAHFREYGVLRALEDAIVRMYHKALVVSGWERERPVIKKTRVEWRRRGNFYENEDYRWVVGTEQELPDESLLCEASSVLQHDTYQALLSDRNSTFQKPGYTFAKILSLVAVRVLHDPDARCNKDDILRRIEVELTDGLGVCFTGKITRLCNAMIGMEYFADSIDLTSSLEKLNKIAHEVAQAIIADGVSAESPEFVLKYKAECARRFPEEASNASRADMDTVLSAFD